MSEDVSIKCGGASAQKLSELVSDSPIPLPVSLSFSSPTLSLLLPLAHSPSLCYSLSVSVLHSLSLCVSLCLALSFAHILSLCLPVSLLLTLSLAPAILLLSFFPSPLLLPLPHQETTARLTVSRRSHSLRSSF